MPKLHYVIGDATEPIGDGCKYILHVCNNRGAWGSGFVMAISKKWSDPELTYRIQAERSNHRLELGSTQDVPVAYNLHVVNMVAQDGFVSPTNPVALRYSALNECLLKISDFALSGSTMHMPRIGCGLAGGDWKSVSLFINECLVVEGGFDVYVYDLPLGQ